MLFMFVSTKFFPPWLIHFNVSNVEANINYCITQCNINAIIYFVVQNQKEYKVDMINNTFTQRIVLSKTLS